jgi:IS30 family transposase
MSYKHITSKQRVELSVLRRAGIAQKDIALILGLNPSSISRELKRNRSKNNQYHAKKADQVTKRRRIEANQRFRKIENNPWLQDYIKQKLRLYWSPEQIAGRLKQELNKSVISHETIYQYIYEEQPELKKYLRCRKGKYRRRHGTRKREKLREESKKRRIDTRPNIVEKRERLGDWEGDTIIGEKGKKESILTYVDRMSGYLVAEFVLNRKAETIHKATTKRFCSLPRNKRHTITYDNGVEFSDHEFTERDTKTTIYFAHPYHSWERGTNENTNGLLRQFFPKKTSFATITIKDVKKAEKLINSRPRKRLNYLTPTEVFYDKIALGTRM